eukprot:IDg21362t1
MRSTVLLPSRVWYVGSGGARIAHPHLSAQVLSAVPFGFCLWSQFLWRELRSPKIIVGALALLLIISRVELSFRAGQCDAALASVSVSVWLQCDCFIREWQQEAVLWSEPCFLSIAMATSVPWLRGLGDCLLFWFVSSFGLPSCSGSGVTSLRCFGGVWDLVCSRVSSGGFVFPVLWAMGSVVVLAAFVAFLFLLNVAFSWLNQVLTCPGLFVSFSKIPSVRLMDASTCLLYAIW